MALQNLSYVLAERPTDAIIPGKTLRQKISPIPSPNDLKEGEILVETLYLGLEPAMRGWLDGMCSCIIFRLCFFQFSRLSFMPHRIL